MYSLFVLEAMALWKNSVGVSGSIYVGEVEEVGTNDDLENRKRDR